MKKFLLFMVICVLCAPFLLAHPSQTKQPPENRSVTSQTTNKNETRTQDIKKSPSEKKCDPFSPDCTEPPPPCKKKGIECLFFEDLKVIGVFELKNQRYAQVKSIRDKKTYRIKKGQKFRNGDLLDIKIKQKANGKEDYCLIFRKKTDDPIKPYISIEKCITSD